MNYTLLPEKKLILGFILVLFFPLLTGCLGGKVVEFSTSPRNQLSVIRLYFDREGSLYPEKHLLKKNEMDKQNGFMIQYYDHRKDEFKQLLSENNLQTTGRFEDWFKLQHKLRSNAAEIIDSRLQLIGKETTVVYLIHGFNVKAHDADFPFHEVENLISEQYLKCKKVLFVEIRWDGRSGLPQNIWTYAQANARFVGLALREIISQTSKDHPVRIFTHSLGAEVATTALWNVQEATKSRANEELKIWGIGYNAYIHNKEYASTPLHADLRLAMLAPAIPGLTFEDFNERTPAKSPTPNNYKKIIVGANRFDIATSKWILPSSFLGSTILAVDKREFTKYVQSKVDSSCKDCKCYWIDFYPVREKGSRNHSIIGYLKRPQIDSFFNNFLN